MNKNESLSRAEALRDEIFRAYNLIQFLGGDDHSVTLPKEGDWVKWIANEIDRAAHPSIAKENDMSWDIGIEVNGIRFENADWNYTHNCNPMMRDAGYDWIYHLHGELVADTLPKFQAMVENLEANPEKYRAMNPDNGWGDYDRLCTLWREILPRAKEIVESIPNATWLEWS